MAEAIQAINVSKVYSDGKKALDNFSLSVEEKSVYSLLGRNGAGKTTFTKIAATILKPTSGELRVLGYDLEKETSKIRRRVAIVPQEGRPFSLQTPYEHVYMYLIARGWSMSDARIQANRILDKLELTEYKDKMCSLLSGGLKQRVMIAMAAAAQPELIFLDEPTIGLDPIARMSIWGDIRDMVDDGTTVFLTTHYMEEAETLSKRVGIVDLGRKIVEGTPGELKTRLEATMSVAITGKSHEAIDFTSYGRVHRSGSTIRVLTNDAGARELSNLAVKMNLSVSVRPTTLEDVFISLVGEMD
ncbi:MAG: ABC transporter ATP-binding protein [Thermoprotei archaeon]